MTIATGLIGYGYAGATFHAPLIAAAPGLRLAAVASSKPERVRAELLCVEPVPDAAALLARPEIGLVVVATPNAQHHPLALAALRAGKHVVVDKPFALAAAEAEEMIAAARAAGRVLSVFHNRRWDGDFLTLQALIAAGALGRVHSYEANFDRWRPVVRDRWRERDEPGGGLLYDLGPHLIDQALALFGAPLRVAAALHRHRPGSPAVDAFDLRLDFGDAAATLRAGMLTRLPRPRFVVHGTAGSFVKSGLDVQEDQLKAGLRPGAPGWGIEPAAQHAELATETGGIALAARPETLPGRYEAYYQGIAAAIAGEAPAPVPPEAGRDTLRIIEAALLSAQEGRTVAL
ncbi:MAG TPA: oxidoreductase [Alphaproteobacteria bacterium]|nr:oxidoreductase [Alphaproteobacteria bacterium]